MKKLGFAYFLLIVWAGFTLAQEIRVLLPNGGEKWVLGESKVIRWRSSGLSNNVKIVLFKDGNPLGPIAGNVDPVTGLFPWTVGNYQGGKALTGTGFRIKIKELESPVADQSDEDFEILKTKPPTPTPPPDIVVTDVKCARYGMGGKFPITVSLENKGGTATGPFQVKVEWTHHNPPFSTPTYIRNLEASLGAYSTQELTTDNVLERPEKRYVATAFADYGNAVTESNEKNNQLTRPIPAWSLVVKNVNIHKNNTQDTYVTLKVKSKGPLASPPYWIWVIFRPDTGPYPPTVKKSVPAQGDGEERFFTFDSGELPSGEYFMQVFCNLYENPQRIISNPVDRPNYHKIQSGSYAGPFDLKIKEVTRHRNNKPDTYIKFKVKNVGQGTSLTYKIKYSFTPQSGNPGSPQSFFSEQYNGVNPNAVRQHTISNQLLVGKWKLVIWVMPEPGGKGESDTNSNNNIASQKYFKKQN